MKEGILIYKIFEKGDYIRSRHGVGIVIEDETIKNNLHNIYYNDIKIQYKNNYERNYQNIPTSESRHNIFHISKKEYEKEPFHGSPIEEWLLNEIQ
jgi:hypothetical protein